MPKMENAGKLRQIPIDQIIENENVRTEYADIEELAASIKAVGQLEPVLVKSLGKNKKTQLEEFDLIAGFRRRRAFQYLKDNGDGFTMIDAVVVSGDKLTLQLVENLQRSDLTPRDREAGIYQLNRAGVNNKEIAARLSKSDAFVSRNIGAYKVRSHLVKAATEELERCEEKGDKTKIDATKKWLDDINELSTQALCEIQGIKKDILIPISKRLIAGGGTVACARQLVRDYNAPKKEPPPAPEETAPKETESEPDVSMGGGDIDPLSESTTEGDGEAGEGEPTKTTPKAPSTKQTSTQPPVRVLEEPPHKNVDLNSVQRVIQTYIDKVGDLESGYSYEFKTNAAYEIWSLLLAELAGL
jgi:ParB/RepB/Spo0J family partition protein